MPRDACAGPEPGLSRAPGHACPGDRLLFDDTEWGAWWTSTRRCDSGCSESWQPRATARSWTSAGGASARCSQPWSSSVTRSSRPNASSAASGARPHRPTRPGPCRRTSATCAGGSSPRPWPAGETVSSRARQPGTSCGCHPMPSTRGASSEPSRPLRAWHPPRRCARSTTPCGCGAARPTPSTSASPGSRPRPCGSPSCTPWPASGCWSRASSWATPPWSSVSSRPWWPRTRSGRSGGGCWRSRSTGPSGRRAPWRRLRRAREILAEELGVDPGPALRALEAEVLAQSPSLDAPAPRVAGRPPRRRGRRPDGRTGRAGRAGRTRRRTGPARRPRRPGPRGRRARADGG